jgi:hypothetical protein
VRITFIHLAQEVYLDAERRLCVLGIFDAMAVSSPVRPLPLPQFTVVVGFEGEPGEPLEREFAVTLHDDDEVPLEEIVRTRLRLRSSPHGHPPKGFAALHFPPGRTFVREFGDYHFHIWQGERAIGSTRLSVHEAEPEGGLREL